METENQPQEAKKTEAKPDAKAAPAAPAAPKPQAAGAKAAGAKLVAILIRNVTQADGKIRSTLEMLRLKKKFTCVMVENNPVMRGMLDKVKDYVTYGEIDADTLKLLEDKRGVKDKEGNLKKHFHLQPPVGGFERKGLKHSFRQGGVVGYRGDKINILLKKMI